MDDETKLKILKHDLQTTTSANDEYLKSLLEYGKAAIIREGIKFEEETIELDMAVIHYAAYLFRKRAGKDTMMPRFLRYELNNILFSQRGKTSDL
jgi:hypothetical protein